MINIVLLGLNILLLIVIWNFMIKKTILDHYRDKLFDLRKEVRDYFLNHEMPLNSPVYKSLYDLLNGHLRFTEDISFSKFIFIEARLRNNDSLKQHLKKQLDSKFVTENEELNKFVSDIRARAVAELMNYMISSSGITWIAVFFILLIYTPYKLIEGLVLFVSKLVSNGFNVFANIVFGLSSLIEDIASVNTQIFGRTVKRDLLEEYYFKCSMVNMGCAA